MRMSLALSLLLASLAFPPKADARVQECVPLQDWGDVPADVRASLESRFGPVAAKHEKFNATDIAWDDAPSNRFLSACRQDDLVAIAIERGGYGYNIQVFHYRAGQQTQRWTQWRGEDIDLLQPPER